MLFSADVAQLKVSSRVNLQLFYTARFCFDLSQTRFMPQRWIPPQKIQVKTSHSTLEASEMYNLC